VEITSIYSSDPLNVHSSVRPSLTQNQGLKLLSNFPEICYMSSYEKLDKVRACEMGLMTVLSKLMHFYTYIPQFLIYFGTTRHKRSSHTAPELFL
jgi:hypothetical protein